MRRTIFFDLDGTLIDTSERHYRVFEDILNLHQIENTHSKADFWNQKRNGKKTLDLLPSNCSKKFIQEFSDEWIDRVEDIEYLKYDRLYSESLDVLSVLKCKSDLVLVTLRNNKKNLLWELGNFGLTSYFKQILLDSPLESRDKVSLIQEYMSPYYEKKNLIIVGDSEVDIETGKKIGISTIAVTCGIRSRSFLRKLKPNFCVNKLCKIIEILNGTGD